MIKRGEREQEEEEEEEEEKEKEVIVDEIVFRLVLHKTSVRRNGGSCSDGGGRGGEGGPLQAWIEGGQTGEGLHQQRQWGGEGEGGGPVKRRGTITRDFSLPWR